jgi:hypothetical protein
MAAYTMAASVVTGSWGGNGVLLLATDAGARVEYDCAAGTIDEPLLLNEEGDFVAHGRHVFEPGGPRRLDEPPPISRPSEYHGSIVEDEMSLTVILLDTGEELGRFRLGRNQPADLEKCL